MNRVKEVERINKKDLTLQLSADVSAAPSPTFFSHAVQLTFSPCGARARVAQTVGDPGKWNVDKS